MNYASAGRSRYFVAAAKGVTNSLKQVKTLPASKSLGQFAPHLTKDDGNVKSIAEQQNSMLREDLIGNSFFANLFTNSAPEDCIARQVVFGLLPGTLLFSPFVLISEYIART